MGVRHGVACAATVLLAVSLAGCSADDDPEQTPDAAASGYTEFTFDASDFSTDITNPYWPMPVGARWVYSESEPGEPEQRVVVTVTDRTKTVAAGVEARVVHDVVTEDGELVEDTFDWYAQDGAGNIWYLGEATTEFEDGRAVTTEGSWEAGVDGAEAGVLIPADPEPGMSYRQEFLAGEAEDEAEVLSTSEPVEAAAGRYTDALLTRETTALEPRGAELKFFAPGVGPVLVLQTSGGASREELLSVRGVG